RAVLDVPSKDLHELRIDARTPRRQRMADDPKHHAGNPQLQAQPDSGGQRAVGDRHGARRTAQQDRLGQRAMQRHLEAVREGVRGTHTTAAPEKMKKGRKKLEAAKAMDRPKTIWISLRNPPDVSPKASARPVAMMMITATMRATGPCMDSRMDCSGPSHGIEEPAACAVPASNSISAASSSPCPAGRDRRCSRASMGRRKSGFTERRKASTCVMTVLQVGQWSGKAQRQRLQEEPAAAREMAFPAHPPGGSPRRRNR